MYVAAFSVEIKVAERMSPTMFWSGATKTYEFKTNAAIIPTALPVQITLNASPDQGPALRMSPLALLRYKSLDFLASFDKII